MRAVAEVVVHHLLGVEGTHHKVALPHIGQLDDVFARGVYVLAEHVVAGHVGAIDRPFLEDALSEFSLEALVITAEFGNVGVFGHYVPGVGGGAPIGRLTGVDFAQGARAELDDLWYFARLRIGKAAVRSSIVSAPMLHFSVRLIFGSNASA